LCRGKLFFQFTNPPFRVSKLRGDSTVHTGNLSRINPCLLMPAINCRRGDPQLTGKLPDVTALLDKTKDTIAELD
jgi:hypothetical protein